MESTSRFQVKRCKIQTSESGGGFRMVVATVLNKESHRSFEVMEWLRDETHVERRESAIKENQQVDESLIKCKDLFDLLDSKLKEMQNTQQEQKINLLMKLRSFIHG